MECCRTLLSLRETHPFVRCRIPLAIKDTYSPQSLSKYKVCSLPSAIIGSYVMHVCYLARIVRLLPRDGSLHGTWLLPKEKGGRLSCVQDTSCLCSAHPAQWPWIRQLGQQRNRTMKRFTPNLIVRFSCMVGAQREGREQLWANSSPSSPTRNKKRRRNEATFWRLHLISSISGWNGLLHVLGNGNQRGLLFFSRWNSGSYA